MTGRLAAMTGGALLLAATIALAQTPQPLRVAGTIESMAGGSFVLKPASGENVTVKLSDKPQVFGVERVTAADIKPGDYIGVGGMPQPDGSEKAIQVTIFADSQRNIPEGVFPWNRPGSSMTNATVASTVEGTDGHVVTVKYKDGEKKIVIDQTTEIRRYVPGELGELKPGARVALPRAEKLADGSLAAARVYVGRTATP